MADYLASFHEFLSTGRLGPITTELNLGDVTKLLGPPAYWIKQGEDPFPLYWGYNYLEINFSCENPFVIDFFQLETGAFSSGSFHIFGRNLAMSMDGLTESMMPSRLLRNDLWGASATIVIWPSADVMYVRYAALEAAFRLSGQWEEHGLPAAPDALGAAIKTIDATAELDSIYSFPPGRPFYKVKDADVREMTGSDYLSLLAV